MDSPGVIWVFGFLVVGLLLSGEMGGGGGGGVEATRRSCGFEAIYNFGDSNSDTGGRSAALGVVPSPNGETFFRKPSGRACDGRLIVDFIAENLGLPYLSAYLDSIGTNFRHGANFATGGSSIRPGGYSPFHLDLQISQFIQFKSRTTALYMQLTNNGELCLFLFPSLPIASQDHMAHIRSAKYSLLLQTDLQPRLLHKVARRQVPFDSKQNQRGQIFSLQSLEILKWNF